MNSPHSPGKFILNTLPRRNNGHRLCLLSADLSGKNPAEAGSDSVKVEAGLLARSRDPVCTDALYSPPSPHSHCSDKTKAESRVSASVFNLYVFTDSMIFPLAGLTETLLHIHSHFLYLRNARYANGFY